LSARAGKWNSGGTNSLPVTTHAAAIFQKRTAEEITPQALLSGLWNYLSNIRANHPSIWEELVAFSNPSKEETK
jgi:hypothetical protein